MKSIFFVNGYLKNEIQQNYVHSIHDMDKYFECLFCMK